jgi:hypothetical protein
MSAWKKYKEKNIKKTNKDLDLMSDQKDQEEFINNQSIFISLPALHESELLETVVDCFKKAKNPDKVFIGICNQRLDDDPFEDFSQFKNVRTIELKSKFMIGLGMAFLLSSWLIRDEDFFFRIDRS